MSKNYFVQKDKYSRRTEKFLMMGGASVVATMGFIVAAPALGALAVPLLAASAVTGCGSIAGFTVNKVAEKITDVYEEKTMRQRFASSIKSMRDKAFGRDSGNDIKMKM